VPHPTSMTMSITVTAATKLGRHPARPRISVYQSCSKFEFGIITSCPQAAPSGLTLTSQEPIPIPNPPTPDMEIDHRPQCATALPLFPLSSFLFPRQGTCIPLQVEVEAIPATTPQPVPTKLPRSASVRHILLRGLVCSRVPRHTCLILFCMQLLVQVEVEDYRQ
jgi:hypothetical protein